MTNRRHVPDHDVLQDMIPWHLNGTLSDTDARRVAAHLQDCDACRSMSADFEAMRTAVQSEELAPLIPATRAVEILAMDRPAQDGTGKNPLRVRLAVAAAAAVFAVALFTSYIAGQGSRVDEPVFHTATSEGSAQGVDYVLHMQFIENMSTSERLKIVESLVRVGKWTVDENDVYAVHLQLEDPSLAGLEAYENRLRSLRGVKSAEFVAIQLPVR